VTQKINVERGDHIVFVIFNESNQNYFLLQIYEMAAKFIIHMGRKKILVPRAIGFQIKLVYPGKNKIKIIFQNIE